MANGVLRVQLLVYEHRRAAGVHGRADRGPLYRGIGSHLSGPLSAHVSEAVGVGVWRK